MPRTRVIFYRDRDGQAPALDWLDALTSKVRDKCRVRLERLRELGHELRRPEADFLRSGIYELRASVSGVHYRILYFFHGNSAVVVSHGLVKEKEVLRARSTSLFGGRLSSNAIRGNALTRRRLDDI